MDDGWTVTKSKGLNSKILDLKKEHLKIYKLAILLMKELESSGPIRKNWPHFNKLTKSKSVPESSYHCHLKEGRPTYVACWRIVDKVRKIIEVYYVGTHENAPY
jgi:hypothetical protein